MVRAPARSGPPRSLPPPSPSSTHVSAKLERSRRQQRHCHGSSSPSSNSTQRGLNDHAHRSRDHLGPQIELVVCACPPHRKAQRPDFVHCPVRGLDAFLWQSAPSTGDGLLGVTSPWSCEAGRRLFAKRVREDLRGHLGRQLPVAVQLFLCIPQHVEHSHIWFHKCHALHGVRRTNLEPGTTSARGVAISRIARKTRHKSSIAQASSVGLSAVVHSRHGGLGGQVGQTGASFSTSREQNSLRSGTEGEGN